MEHNMTQVEIEYRSFVSSTNSTSHAGCGSTSNGSSFCWFQLDFITTRNHCRSIWFNLEFLGMLNNFASFLLLLMRNFLVKSHCL